MNGKILVKLTRSEDQVSFCSNPARITQSNCQQFPGPVQSADLVSAHFIVTLLIKCTKRLYVPKMNLIVLPHKLLECLLYWLGNKSKTSRYCHSSRRRIIISFNLSMVNKGYICSLRVFQNYYTVFFTCRVS